MAGIYENDGSYRIAFQHDLMTDGNGHSRRLRVDPGQTGFFAGRMFRTYRDFSITGGTTQVIKAVVPLNIILFGLDISSLSGTLVIETVVGGTEGGSFSTSIPIFPMNTMTERPTPIYVNQVVLSTGGTHTGGTVLDLLRIKAADNSNFAASVGSLASDERGVGANTYYYRLSATGDVSAIFKARWEERPAGIGQ